MLLSHPKADIGGACHQHRIRMRRIDLRQLVGGARKEELLVEPDILRKMYVLRRILNPMGTVDAMEFLMDKLRQTKTNSDFFDSMNT